MILDQIKNSESEFIEIRHQIHQNPEIGFQEVNTSQLIASKLTEYGFDVTTGIGKTGVVGVLKVGEGTKRLGLRAEMDALPLQENTGKPYSSQIPGKYHGCGHDGHIATLLSAAKYLAQTKSFNGTLIVIFQPAEEFLIGGKTMVDENLFEKFPCDSIYSLHSIPFLKEGEFYFNDGNFMASSDSLDIEITGVGGHGAIPEKAIDATMIACYIGTALQTIVSRNVSPFDKAVVTIGSVQAGDAYNVINGKANMKLSVRALKNDVRFQILKKISDLSKFQALSFGGTAEVRQSQGCPCLVNGKEATDFAVQVAEGVVGKEKVHTNTPSVMGSEDFSYMLEKIPNGSYFYIGNGDKHALHNSKFDFNDNNIALGATFWAILTEKYLQ